MKVDKTKAKTRARRRKVKVSTKKVDKVESDLAADSGYVWKGPAKDGITYSLLCRFLCCRERFRVYTLEGLRPKEVFNHRIEYGNMWHTCMESGDSWKNGLEEYCKQLSYRYPTQQPEIAKWYRVCMVQYPLYLDYWREYEEDTTICSREEVFDIHYKLPTGDGIRLRGKFDCVREKDGVYYLQEYKCLGNVDESRLLKQMRYNLQTMFYLTALTYGNNKEIGGVEYCVTRRPLSGGKGTIRQRKPTKSNPSGETDGEFYSRLGGIIEEDANEFFYRFKTTCCRSDVDVFRRDCLDPILHQLLWWYMDFVMGIPAEANRHHWRHPYGIYNVLDEGGSHDLDEYLDTHSEIGLERVDNLFPEL